MIIGYKSFNSNLENMHGVKMVEGNTYKVSGDIKYGLKGNGYHFAKNLEDTLRFQIKDDDNLVNPMIAKVIGDGKIIESSDEYYGYYDLYVAEMITIKKVLTRKEVIEYALNLSELRMQRFVSLFKLYDDEIKLFEGKYSNVDKAILYYQKKVFDVYNIDNNSNNKYKQLIKK